MAVRQPLDFRLSGFTCANYLFAWSKALGPSWPAVGILLVAKWVGSSEAFFEQIIFIDKS